MLLRGTVRYGIIGIEAVHGIRRYSIFAIPSVSGSDINDAPFPIPEDILNNKDHHYLSLLV